MGMGDEIIATGDARELQKTFAADFPGEAVPKVLIVDRLGRPRWHMLWQQNPRIVAPNNFRGGAVLKLTHGARCRPYVDYERMKAEWPWENLKYDVRLVDRLTPWRFTDAKVNRGEIYGLPALERRPTRIIIEPHAKAVTPNREWPWKRYQAVVDAIPDVEWVQIDPIGAKVLNGVKSVPADSPWKAIGMMQTAAAYFGPEGGLYHAAAAVDVPAVAIFGGYVSPRNQGYDGPGYFNLYEPMGGESPCGQRVSCEHCKKAMDLIEPELVIQNLKFILNPAK